MSKGSVRSFRVPLHDVLQSLYRSSGMWDSRRITARRCKRTSSYFAFAVGEDIQKLPLEEDCRVCVTNLWDAHVGEHTTVKTLYNKTSAFTRKFKMLFEVDNSVWKYKLRKFTNGLAHVMITLG